MSTAVYLDCNATTAPAPQVVAEMLDALQIAWANPSSTHAPGQAARRLLADARTRVAAFLGCQGAELVFTSGATEANHMAVLGALAAARTSGRRRWVLSAVEHPGLLALAQRLADEGVAVDRIGVDAQGRLDLAQARALIADDVAVVSLMGANNETGVLMPLREVAELAHAHGALLHVDATQLAGKLPLSFAGSGIDLMAVSAHKLAGPKGSGALLIRKGLVLPPLLSGRQERHRRGGTENLPGIAGFAAACDLAAATLADDLARMQALRELLEAGLTAIAGVQLYGRDAERLPNTICLRFGELDAEQVLSRLERAGVVASSGAACSAGGTQPSHVLLAMGASARQAKAGIRFSLGRETRAADIAATLAAVQRVIVPLLDPQPLAA
ncbi:MAG: cysteine desulfurase family protein [Piscinibacter sp.]